MQSMPLHASLIESAGSYEKRSFLILIEVASFPQNTGPARHRYRTKIDGFTSISGPVSSPAVYSFSISLLLLSRAWAQQLAFRPGNSSA